MFFSKNFSIRDMLSVAKDTAKTLKKKGVPTDPRSSDDGQSFQGWIICSLNSHRDKERFQAKDFAKTWGSGYFVMDFVLAENGDLYEHRLEPQGQFMPLKKSLTRINASSSVEDKQLVYQWVLDEMKATASIDYGKRW